MTQRDVVRQVGKRGMQGKEVGRQLGKEVGRQLGKEVAREKRYVGIQEKEVGKQEKESASKQSKRWKHENVIYLTETQMDKNNNQTQKDEQR